MLQGLFNYDNPVWRFVGKLGDLVLLNILWIICSLPIFTIGASTTAVYYVTLKLARDDDGSTIRCFFRSFKNNFKQATVIWLIMLIVGCVLGFDFWFFRSGQMAMAGMTRMIVLAIFGAFMLVYLLILTYVFALQARFYNPIKRTLLNAFFMSIRHLAMTVTMLVADVAVVVAGVLSLWMIPQISLLFFLFGFPLIAFVNSYFFTAIFKNYMPKDEQEQENGALRPILGDDGEDPEDIKAAIRSLKGEDKEN